MKSKKDVVTFVLLFVLLGIFLFSAGKIIHILITSEKEKAAFDNLSALVEKAKSQQTSDTTSEGTIPSSEITSPQANQKNAVSNEEAPIESESNPAIVLPQYVQLHKMNPDLFGWIYIEGTNIDYPVMYSPEDPEYYLHRAFDGSYSNSGVPFLGEGCSPDGSYYLIYGHHMKNQTMFGQLPYYSKQDYCEEHHLIRFDTLYESRNYKVIAAFYSRVYDKDETDGFRYYEYNDLSDVSVFNKYIQEIRKASIYDTGFDISFGDELLALSTCSYHTEEGRFVVVAKRVDNAGK